MTNPVLDLFNNNPQSFHDKVRDTLMQKVSDRLELEKAVIASNLFSPKNSTEESPEGDIGTPVRVEEPTSSEE